MANKVPFRINARELKNKLWDIVITNYPQKSLTLIVCFSSCETSLFETRMLVHLSCLQIKTKMRYRQIFSWEYGNEPTESSNEGVLVLFGFMHFNIEK